MNLKRTTHTRWNDRSPGLRLTVCASLRMVSATLPGQSFAGIRNDEASSEVTV